MVTSTLGSGTLVLAGTTSGTTTVTATAVAGTTTLTLPAATDTLVGKATTDTLTNKTLTTPSVSSPTISDGTANGVAYLNGSKVLTTGSALSYNGTTLSATYANNAFAAGLVVTNSTNGASAQARIDMINSAGNALVAIQNSPSVNSGTAFIGTSSTQALTFGTSYTESMRLDSSGNLLVGTTTSASSRLCLEYTGASLLGQNINDSDNTNNSTFVQFQIQGTQVGTIKRVGTTSAVIYNTTSDYRLKTVTGAVTGQGDRIDALKPIVFQWKEGGQQAKGFLAHEFQAVYANSVSGDKDAVDTNGKPVYQAMQASTSEVIADLVAEIQSLRKRLAALESA